MLTTRRVLERYTDTKSAMEHAAQQMLVALQDPNPIYAELNT